MNEVLKTISARLPIRWQQELRRRHYSRQIGAGRFTADEPEYGCLAEMIGEGDWVIDVGANIGHYTLRFSELVGETGRVIAFEPVPATFELLAANSARARYRNITLLNAAASDSQSIAGMEMPKAASGLDNPYMAHLTAAGRLKVMCFSVNALRLSGRVRLIKIDAEGHELSVVRGMSELLERDHPRLIIEGDDAEVQRFLGGFGYSYAIHSIPGSWNRIYSS